MKSLNWLLYEVHRWLGVGLAVFMLVWFASGLLIMYSSPTTPSRSEQLLHAESLAVETGWLSLGEAWDRSAEQRKTVTAEPRAERGNESGQRQAAAKLPVSIADARLLRNAGQPQWLVEDTQGQRFAISAIDGGLLNVTPELALKIAQHWFKAEAADNISLSFVETIDSSTFLRNQNALRPFHRVANEDGTELLISARTGEVLHASTSVDRAFYYGGNWIHLFKPLDLLGLGEWRHDVQLWSGLGATIACLTGLIIGWLRWRPGFGGKPTYSQGRTQPYREFWFKWHFWSGLLGGTLALSWALSGFLDTNPGKLFATNEISKAELSHYLGEQLPDVLRDWQPGALSTPNGDDIVELNWRRIGQNAVLLAHARDGQRLPQTPEGVDPRFTETALSAAVQRVFGEHALATVTQQNDYDSYYYPRHHQGLVEKPLPVVVAELGDEAGTRLYLDPQDGRILSKIDDRRKVLRWAYSALHHWDFGWLYYRPIWDVWMLIWVGFGLILSGTSLVIGWKRLKKTFAPKKKPAVRRGVIAEPQLVTESAGD